MAKVIETVEAAAADLQKGITVEGNDLTYPENTTDIIAGHTGQDLEELSKSLDTVKNFLDVAVPTVKLAGANAAMDAMEKNKDLDMAVGNVQLGGDDRMSIDFAMNREVKRGDDTLYAKTSTKVNLKSTRGVGATGKVNKLIKESGLKRFGPKG